MDIEDLLMLGSPRKGDNKSPLKRKQERNRERAGQKKSIVESVAEHGFVETVSQMGLSETAVAKICTPLIRKGELNLTDIYSDIPVEVVEEYIYSMNTTSIKRLCEHSEFSEAVLRLVKAHIEGRQRVSYGEE